VRDPRPTLRLSLLVLFAIGLALMWWWPTRAPVDGAPVFPPVAPPLPEAMAPDASDGGSLPATTDGG
jgi:hypothetical protein